MKEARYTLVTGGSGFIGKSFLHYISNTHKNIINISRYKNNLESTITCDLSKEIPDLSRFSIGEVYHFAGLAHIIDNDLATYEDYYNANVVCTLNLLKSLEKNNYKELKILFLSSVSVYGLNVGHDIPETHPSIADDFYGKTKSIAENHIIKYCIKNSFKYTIVRPPLVVGGSPKGNLKN